ncbi:MAG: hypothetical protein ACK50P_15025 [Planctomycetaceae bacterium]
MFPASWFGARWFAAPYWRGRSTPPPPVDPEPTGEVVVVVGQLPPRGTNWRLAVRPTVCGMAPRYVVWHLPPH